VGGRPVLTAAEGGSISVLPVLVLPVLPALVACADLREGALTLTTLYFPPFLAPPAAGGIWVSEPNLANQKGATRQRHKSYHIKGKDTTRNDAVVCILSVLNAVVLNAVQLCSRFG